MQNQLSSMSDLMVMNLQDLYSAKTQQLSAMPALMQAASDDELRTALEQHARETQAQVGRLEQVLAQMGEQPGQKQSRAAGALLSEIQEVARMPGDADVKDAALVAGQQKFEHSEIACYGTAMSLAKQAGNQQAAQLLAQSLDEEERMDRQLTHLAKARINKEAEAAAPDEGSLFPPRRDHPAASDRFGQRRDGRRRRSCARFRTGGRKRTTVPPLL